MKRVNKDDAVILSRNTYETSEILPFIMMNERTVIDGLVENKMAVVWMEFFAKPLTDEGVEQIWKSPRVKMRHQTLESYRQLPLIDFGNGLSGRRVLMVKPELPEGKTPVLLEARYKGHYFAGFWYE